MPARDVCFEIVKSRPPFDLAFEWHNASSTDVSFARAHSRKLVVLVGLVVAVQVIWCSESDVSRYALGILALVRLCVLVAMFAKDREQKTRGT